MTPSNAIIKLAISQARLSKHDFRLGAIVYRKSEVYGLGFNKHDKTHPKSPHPFKTIHAEFDAVLEALYVSNHSRLDGFSIYVHRLKANDSSGLAKPCKHCQFMLDQVGIKDIHWSK